MCACACACLLDAMCCFIYKEDEEAELAGGDVKWNTERQVTHMGVELSVVVVSTC